MDIICGWNGRGSGLILGHYYCIGYFDVGLQHLRISVFGFETGSENGISTFHHLDPHPAPSV
jgi:hypothetical protein